MLEGLCRSYDQPACFPLRKKEGKLSKQLFDETITAEMPGEFCLYCGIPLKTDEEVEAGLCADHLGPGGEK